MSQILKEYPSRSNPAKKYHVIRGGDGVTYCDCPAWRFNTARTCKHLEDYLSGQHQYTVRKEDNVTYLEEAIKRAVEELR